MSHSRCSPCSPLATCLFACVLAACGSGGSNGSECVNTGDPGFGVTPTNLLFTNVCAGESVTLSVSMRYVGTCGDVTVSGARLDGLGDEFTLSFTPVTLLPEQSAVASVTYSPKATANARSGNLALEHDIVDMGNLTLIPVVASEGQLANLMLSPNPIDFGVVAVGGFRDLDVVVKNLDCATWTINAVSLDLAGSPAFALLNIALPDDGSMPLGLVHNASISLTMRYQPTDCAAANSTLTITGTSAGSNETWTFDVLGTGSACSSE